MGSAEVVKTRHPPVPFLVLAPTMELPEVVPEDHDTEPYAQSYATSIPIL